MLREDSEESETFNEVGGECDDLSVFGCRFLPYTQRFKSRAWPL